LLFIVIFSGERSDAMIFSSVELHLHVLARTPPAIFPLPPTSFASLARLTVAQRVLSGRRR
jgi:hypothetical protein